MTKKLRFEFSQAELQALISGLRPSGDPELAKITDKFLQRALKNSLQQPVAVKTGLKALYEPASEAGATVIRSLSILSGWPVPDIKPHTLLDELSLSSQHMDYLRMNLNVWIKQHDGSDRIYESEMTAAETVQDIIDLVTSKL